MALTVSSGETLNVASGTLDGGDPINCDGTINLDGTLNAGSGIGSFRRRTSFSVDETRTDDFSIDETRRDDADIDETRRDEMDVQGTGETD